MHIYYMANMAKLVSWNNKLSTCSHKLELNKLFVITNKSFEITNG